MSLTSLSGLGFGGAGIPDAMPKAIAELQGQMFSLVAGAAANTAIAIPGIEATDTVKTVLDLTTPATIPAANVTVIDRRASGTITLLSTIADGDVIAVNGKSYTFTEMHTNPSSSAGPGVIPITTTPSGVDVDAVAAKFANVLMSSDSNISASHVAGVVTVTWRVAGTAGNSVTLSVANAHGHATASGATLTGGTATTGIKISTTTAGKNLLVVWYDKP
jgi:hypothetical protein